MKIYRSTETNFNTNGLGFLVDLLEAYVVDNLNGEYYLQFRYPIGGANADYLEAGNIIKCNVSSTDEQLFRISKVVKTFTEMTVYAPHIFYDLADNILLNVQPTNLNAQNFGNWILQRTEETNPFTFQSSIAGTKSAKYVRRNPIEAIMGDIDNSMVKLFGGEVERDNFNIKFLTRRGADNHVKLLFGKNIKEIKITTDISGLYTKVLPLGFNGLMLPEIFVESPLIDDYPTPRITKIEFSNIKVDPNDETAYQTEEEAYEALRNAVNELYENGMDKPGINIKIDWLELSKTEEYKNYSALETVHMGDTITANILGLNYETRVISTTYNVLTDTIDNFEIGTVAKNIVNSINQVARSVESVNVSSILDSARQNATNLITTAMGGYVYKTQEELYIMDTDDPATAQKVWRWNLNGLGYSSTGINGTYETAITQDGAIVADFVTAGTLSASVIEGFSELITRVTNSPTQSDLNNLKAELQSLIIQESDRITLSVQKIENGTNSVGKVKTASAQLDENGLSVIRDGSDTQTRIDDKGIEVLTGTETLLKAKVENGDSIVESKYLKVNEYLSIGTRSRFEDYNEDENGNTHKFTGVFWIGE